ncbi:FGGY family carbohydrate kinase [Meiothermus sp.]|uniref:FGGY family carbohydrate kinase n=1 Tax=Meiothermus sp. TaxID=1955249 RepID=UPI0027E3C9A9|nr:FGGY family carbohydrate kinase [Meiothermus sp.]
MKPVGIGMDLGTSGLKAIAITADGRTVAAASTAYPLLTPRPGWTEQNPSDWVEAAHQVLGELAQKLKQENWDLWFAGGTGGNAAFGQDRPAAGHWWRAAPISGFRLWAAHWPCLWPVPSSRKARLVGPPF